MLFRVRQTNVTMYINGRSGVLSPVLTVLFPGDWVRHRSGAQTVFVLLPLKGLNATNGRHVHSAGMT